MDRPDEPTGDPAEDESSDLSSESLLRMPLSDSTTPDTPPTSAPPSPGPTFEFTDSALPPDPTPSGPASAMPPLAEPSGPIEYPPGASSVPAQQPPPVPTGSAAAQNHAVASPNVGSTNVPPPPPFMQSPPAPPGQPQPTGPPPPAKHANQSKKPVLWFVLGGVAALIIVGAIIAVIAGPSERRQAEQSVVSALDEVGIDADDVTFRPTRDEERCLVRQGVTNTDILDAYSASSGSAFDSQSELLNATLICTPRIIDDEFWMEQLRATFSVGLGTDLSLDEMKCTVQYAMDNNRLRPGDVLSGIDEPGLLDAVEACFTEETMAILRGDPGTGPQNYGDDAAFDQLFDLCSDGRNEACDILYGLASLGSEYALVAEDCNGRGLESTYYCSTGIVDNNANGYADDSSAGLRANMTLCNNGDMLSCDFVFAVSELDSTYVDAATSCGERRVLATDTCLGQYGLTAE